MTLRFGVAGIGYWADTVHLPGLAAQPEAELVGAWGRNSAALAEVTQRHGIRAFTRFEEMLEAVDAVSISLPPAVQAELAVLAARAGKHLLLEKPIAPDLAAAERLAEAVEHAGVASVVFFTRRFVPAFEQALEAAAQRTWTGARVRQLTEALTPGSPYAGSIWRQAPNGALWDIGPHTLSVLLAVLGPIERISASWSSDRVSRFTATHLGGQVSEAALSLHAAKADLASEYLFLSPDGDVALPLPTFPRPEALAAAAGELIRTAARGDRHHRCDVRLGLKVVRVLAAAERSVASGRPVSV